ncbi:MAG: hypothetical protein IT204_02725 [Fimbriimonadaceae bacterium]|nr:hypothetical protein [Fimbriimonadaceae bacterium]
MHSSWTRWLLAALLLSGAANRVAAQACAECHKAVTPAIVSDWKLSKHAQNEVTCAVCHGTEHNGPQNVEKAGIPTPEVCKDCHEEQVTQFSKGKHALAWAAMDAMPTIHFQPMAMTQGKKGCGGCHKIGLKSEDEIADLKKAGAGFGVASCDSCHTRHTFSKLEAQQPQACMTCHTGFDHPQWEMYSGSKHGVRYLLKQNKTLPPETAAPTCQTCHLAEGNHNVRTAWGFLGLRLPLAEDKEWQADQVTILQALGVLTPDGKPTARLDLAKGADLLRGSQAEWQRERDKMLSTCGNCHSSNFAKAELQQGDDMIRAADKLMAQGINLVGDLYKEGLLSKPQNYAYTFPDLLTFHDAPSRIEQRLFVMFLEQRNRTFQGTFHANPDYALWYGWSAMQQSLGEIKALAEELRARKR